MLSDTKIIALYCLVDDLLKAMHHYQEPTARISDSEVITTAFVAALYFGGHQENSRHFMKMSGYVPHLLSKSRFNRRLHRLSDLTLALFYGLGKHLKDRSGATDYQLDSFPVTYCDNMRIKNRKLLKPKAFVGRHATMHRYLCGVRVQVLTLKGIPVEFCLVPASENDTQALRKLPLDVAAGSCIYVDAGYTDYTVEDELVAAEGVYLKTARKSNSKRPDSAAGAFIKDTLRKHIEGDIAQIKARMLRSVHAVSEQGFLLKVALFVIAHTFDPLT